MTLLLDVGNSRIKWGLAEGDVITRHGAAATVEDLCLEAEAQGNDGPHRILAVNVAGVDAGTRVATALQSCFAVQTRFLTATAEALGVRNAYQRPGQLGADRWAAIVATALHHPLPACVIDCGTTVTVDIVDAQRRHRGGWIAPGSRLMRHSLSVGTAGIGLMERADATAPGRNTQTCVGAGVTLAVLGMVQAAIEEATALLGERPTCVLTGGGGERLAHDLRDTPVVRAPLLVLQGVLALGAV